jgi:hypothetical protein
MASMPLLTDVPPIPADWSQFFPDLVISALVGLALAGVVIRLESRITSRREQRDAELQWGLVRPRVSAALGRPYWETPVTYGNSSLESLTEIASSFRKLATKYPFGAWSASAPKNLELKLAADAAQTLFEMDEATGFLDPALEQHYGLSGIYEDSEVWDHVSYSRLRIMDDALRGSPSLAEERPEEYDVMHAEMLSEIGDAVQRFQVARPAFEKAWTDARQAIRGTWGDDLRGDI